MKVERPAMSDGKYGSPEWPVARMTWEGWREPESCECNVDGKVEEGKKEEGTYYVIRFCH